MKDIRYESRKGKYYHKCQIFVISCLEYKLLWMQKKYGQNPDISRNNIYIPYHSECKVIIYHFLPKTDGFILAVLLSLSKVFHFRQHMIYGHPMRFVLLYTKCKS